MRLIRRPRPLLAWAALAALALTGCAQFGVIRVVDGREIEGRFISERAYAFYARAAYGEARGDFEAALAAYGAAAAEDAGSAEIWTRIGAVRCELKGKRGDPDEAFSLAEEHDAAYEPLWRERARCAFARGQIEAALDASARAVALDPEREQAAVLHAAALERLSRVEEARRELVAFTIRHPGAADARAALAALDRAGRGPRAAAPGPEIRATDAGPDEADPIAAIDEALGAGDLTRARRLAKGARVASADLAVRAAALGRLDLARDQAELVLGADPLDGSARIALAVAADLLGDAAAVNEAMAGAPAALPAAPSPLARLLFAELLDRRVGLEAARAWLGPAPPLEAHDPLLRRVGDRVRARLAGSTASATGG